MQKQYVRELNWIWPVIVSGDSPEIISSPVTRTSEPERLLFCRIGVLNPWSVHWLISFSHTMQNLRRTSFYQCLPLPLMKLKSSKVLFRFAPPPPLAITSLKPRALTVTISNRTDWRFYKARPIASTSVARTNFIVLFRQNNCFIASVPIWLPTNY